MFFNDMIFAMATMGLGEMFAEKEASKAVIEEDMKMFNL